MKSIIKLTLYSVLGLFSSSVVAQELDSIAHLETTTIHGATDHTHQTREIHGKEWFQKNKTTLASSLEQEANFSSRSMGPAPARPVVRGLSGAHIQIAENGNQVSDLSASSPDHAVSLNQSQLRSIAVLEGIDLIPHSLSLLGARIESDRALFLTPPLDKFNWNLNSQILYPLGLSSGLAVEIPIEKFTARLQTSALENSEIQSPKRVLKESNSSQWEVATGLQTDFEKHTLGADFIHNSMEYGIPGGFVGSHKQGVRISMERNTLDLGQVYHNSKDSLKTTVSLNQFQQLEQEIGGGVGAEFLVKELSVNTQYSKQVNQNLQWQLGLSTGLEDRQYGGFVYTPYTTRQTLGLWGITQLGKQSAFPIALGARMETSQDQLKGIYASRNSEALPERFFDAYSFYLNTEKSWDEVSAQVGIFQSSRIPEVEELYSQGPHLAAYSYDMGNPDLNSELGHGIRAGLGLSPDHWKFDTEAYTVYYSQYIKARPNGQTNWSTELPEYIMSDGKALLWGANLSVCTPEWKHIHLKSQIDYTWGQDLEEETPLPSISPMRIQNTLNFSKKQHSLNLHTIYLFAQNRVAKFEQTTTDNHIVNSDYTFQTAKSWGLIRTQVGVGNIFNQTYRNHLSRIKEIFPEPGRNFYLKVQVNGM